MILGGACLAVLAVLVVIAGCSAGANHPETFAVSGKVTLGGEPVEGATVTFVPADSQGQSAVGVTKGGGVYTLKTFSDGNGALPGKYNVKIVQFEESNAAVEAGGAEATGETAAMPAMPSESAEPKNLLPEKYSNPGQSGLEATVTEGPNTFDFALEK